MLTAVVLAAGKSSRMGRTKALLPIGAHDTFLSRIVKTFGSAGITDLVVVVGHDASAVIERHRNLPSARFIVNPKFEDGQLSSLVAGLDAVDRKADAALVTLVDLPMFEAATVQAVIDRYRQTHAPIVRPVAGGRHGHPILVSREIFDEIRAANPAAGAKPIVRRHATAAGDVDVADAGAFFDIDTPADYENLIQRRRKPLTGPG